ncbi:DUF1801 domain-containing protein [Cellulomonas sp. APG4]|uniref:iron chaperone n=1 Tax=Cellulomonas sp. APG4 TaxID=1538656 RepID=UPI0013797F13|nr:DUF1801 domain-containing protein [Cellulomonas sp. APG4]NCT90282.1 DUF1801 domain-containing protein [Cellulomonas sp. APG4]
MQSDATTPEEYLATLEPERRATVATVRDAVNAAMPEGYAETMAFGMIGWVVPLERYPTTSNGQPLSYVSLAAQKRHCSLYLMGVYADQESAFRERWAGGRALDMGKSCVRFRRVEDLDLPLIAATIASTSVDDHVARYEAARGRKG